MTQPINIDINIDTRPDHEKYARGLYLHVLNSMKHGWLHSEIMKFFVMNSSYTYLPQTIQLAIMTVREDAQIADTKKALTRLVRDGYLYSDKGRYGVNFPENFLG